MEINPRILTIKDKQRAMAELTQLGCDPYRGGHYDG